MQSFLRALEIQRWDDHRYYHHSRINQSLHLLSAVTLRAGPVDDLLAFSGRQRLRARDANKTQEHSQGDDLWGSQSWLQPPCRRLDKLESLSAGSNACPTSKHHFAPV